MAAAARDEDPAGVVDPDLLDLRVVEERLQRAEARHPGDELADHRAVVGDRGDRAGETELVVVGDDVLGDAADEEGLALRVDALATDPLPHLGVEALDQVVVGTPRRLRSLDAINGHGGPASPRTCTVKVPMTDTAKQGSGKGCGQPLSEWVSRCVGGRLSAAPRWPRSRAVRRAAARTRRRGPRWRGRRPRRGGSARSPGGPGRRRRG